MALVDYRQWLETVSESVVALDGIGSIVFANGNAGRLLDLAPEELVGRPLAAIAPEGLGSAPAGLSANGSIHAALRRADGRPIEVTGRAAMAPDGTVLLFFNPRSEETEGCRDPARYFRATAEAAARLGVLSDAETLVAAAAETLVGEFDADRCEIWLRDADAETFSLRAAVGESDVEPFASIELADADHPVARVARLGRPARQDDAAGYWAMFPLIDSEGVVGVICHRGHRRLAAEAHDALSAFAALLGSVLHGIKLMEGLRAARAHAEAQRRRLETVLDTLPVGVMLVEGADGCVTYQNRSGEAIGGAPAPGLRLVADPTVLPLFHMDGRPVEAHERPIVRTLQTGERVRERLRYRRPDEQEIVVDVATAPFPGEVGGAVTTYLDVTNHVRLQEELTQQAAQFKALLDHLPVGVAYFDVDGVCRAVNVPARRTLGRTRLEVQGVPADTLLASAPEVREALAACLAGGGQQSRLGVAWGQVGTTDELRYLDWRFAPLRGSEDRPAGVLALISDETGRKQAELQLQAARDEALNASSNKTRFLSAVSHDLRTPVNALSLQAELLARLLQAEETSKADLLALSADIQQAASNLVELINDLLDLTRFDSGAFEFHATVFPLEEWLASVLAPLQLTAMAKGLDFSWRVEPAGLQLRADRVKLGRVLTNLAGNAVKFTESGGVEVFAGATHERRFLLSVRDTGPGIPPEQRDRIFDEFTQLRNPERDRTRGTGLGLAICKRLVEASGGTLTLQSEVGQGSRFTAVYPTDHLAGEAAAAEPPVEPETREWDAIRRPSPPRPILLVEDDSSSRRSLSRLLEHAGHRVSQAAGGPEALKEVEREVPALVLLDLMMPGMDGAEVLRRLRTRFDRRSLPAIVLSGDVLGERTGELRELDVEAILAKPVDLDHLLRLVARVLEAAAR